jgi:mannose-6-phosphate isomerase-like protein (cupin superfamily)
VGFTVIKPDDLEWTARPSADPDLPERHVAGLTDLAGFQHTRANLFRYPPGAVGRRHKDLVQEETFVVLAGTLSMYLGEPPERHDVEAGGLVHVESGTVLQIANHGAEELTLYIYGAPPEHGHGEFFDSAV